MQLAEYTSFEEMRAAHKARRAKFWPKPVKVVDHTPDVEPVAVTVAAPVEPFIPPAPMVAYADRKVLAIKRAVARHYRCTVSDIDSRRRTADIVRPRQVAMYLAKVLTTRSLPEIGRRIGRRDHTTVLHAVRKIEALRTADADLDSTLAMIEREMGYYHVV